jgi:hypothetical protein
MKEGLKRILGRTGDFLFGGLFILVGIWIIVFIVAHVVTGVHLPEQPRPKQSAFAVLYRLYNPC